MLPKAEERQTDLRNTSIMEVILAVIIVLLLVVYTKDVEIGNIKAHYEEKIARLEQENQNLSKINSELQSENFTLKTKIKELQAKLDQYEKWISDQGKSAVELNRKLADENARLKVEIDELKKKVKELEALLKTAKGNVGAASEEVKKLKAEIALLKKEIEELKKMFGGKGSAQDLLDQLAKLNKKIATLELEKADLKRKLEALEKENAELRRKYGVGSPRCKIEDNKIEWLARVEKVNEGYKFNLTVPSKQRGPLLETVPGLRTLVDKQILTANQFDKAALSIYNWEIASLSNVVST